MASIQFTDGSKLNIWDNSIRVSLNEIFRFSNSVFFFQDPRNDMIYGSTKTDLSGRVWTVSNGISIPNLKGSGGASFVYRANKFELGPRISYNQGAKSYIGSFLSSVSPSASPFNSFPSASNRVIGYFIGTYNQQGTIKDFYEMFINNATVKQIVIFQVFPNGNGISDSQVTLLKDTDNKGFSFASGWAGVSIDVELSFGAGFNPSPYIPNPYEPGGDSGEGGGGGNFDDTSDPIPDSSVPTLSSSNTGFTRIYNPSLSQVQDLARYLWTDETVIQTIWNHIKQYFEDPMQAIIGFNLVPCAVPNGGTKNFALMYIDTGVAMTVAANQFVDVDCGTCEISEYFGSALDYSPYTKISCFLPFIGTVQLNTDEVMKTTLQVKYRIDICSGSCVAKILVNGNVLYQYSGHCAIPIPISASDFSSYVSTAVSVAKLAIGAAVGGGMGAVAAGADNPTQQTNQVVTTTQTTETGRNPATGRQITLGTRTTIETRESPADQSTTQASFSGLTPSNIANTVGQIMTAKPHVEHSGSFSGNSGYLGVRRPYLIIQRPNMCMPSQYQQFNGFPSMITEELSGLKGFTRVQQVQLTGMSATNPEQAEILEMLKSGVII